MQFRSSHGYPIVRLIHTLHDVIPDSVEKLILKDVHTKKVYYEFLINSSKGDGKPVELVHIGK